MQIIPSNQRSLLLEYMGLLKYQLHEWLIVEVKLSATQQVTDTSAVAELMHQLFGVNEGRILICNPTEVLMLIEWGKDNNPKNLVKIIGERLPGDICETTIAPPTKDGLKKIELLIAPPASEHEMLYRSRIARRENVFLIIDDDMYTRLLAKKGLEDIGAVIEVSAGSEAVAAYETHNPDIVLLDIHLPGIGGQEVLDKIRAADPKAYVIMLSADSSLENVQLTKQRGAKGFLTKPFNKARLREYVDACPTVT